MSWYSLHLFCPDPLHDAMILQAIAPALQDLAQHTPSLSWFFLRYWNGGPHVRLRLRGCSHDGLDRLEQRLSSWLQDRIQAPFDPATYKEVVLRMDGLRASLPTESRILLEPAEPLAIAGSIERRPYQFDQARYGSSNAQSLIETHFCTSSALAVRLLGIIDDRTMPRSGLSVCLAAAALAGCQLTGAEAAAFLETVKSQSAALLDAPVTGEATAWPPLEAILCDGLPTSALPPLSNALLLVWQDAIRQAVPQAELLLARGDLRILPRSLVLDFWHLLNNRLGISTRLEPVLLDFLAQRLRRLSPSPVPQPKPTEPSYEHL